MTMHNSARARKQLVLFLLFSFAVVTGLLALSRVDIDIASFAKPAAFFVMIYLIGVFARYRKAVLIDEICKTLSLGFLLTLLVLPVTYIALSFEMPLADRELAAMDRALGFDWHALIGWVDGSPVIANALALAYSSFAFQIILVPILLIATNQPARATAFVAGYGLVCFIASAVSIWWPALGTFTVYGVQQSDLSNINAFFGFAFLNDFVALRAGGQFILVMGKAAGILTFPSVHAAMAFLLIWAAWSIPYLRYPFVMVNLAMALSAVTHANHYLVDVVAGAGIAGLVSAIVSIWLLDRRPVLVPLRRLRPVPSPAGSSG